MPFFYYYGGYFNYYLFMLPGIIVDLYAGFAAVQFTSSGAEKFREVIAQILLEQDERRLMDFFKQLNTIYVECPDANFQFNLNHQEDYLSFLTSNQKQCN